MKRVFSCYFFVIVLVVASCGVARSEVALSVSARNIEYSKYARKYLLDAAQNFPETMFFSSVGRINKGANVQANVYFLTAIAERRYKQLQPITVRLALRNTGVDAGVNCRSDNVLNYTFSVLSPSGEPVPLTSEGKIVLDPYASIYGRMLNVLFPSCSQIVENIQLNRYFDMTRKGTYKIGVSRIVCDGRNMKKQKKIFAEPITLTVE